MWHALERTTLLALYHLSLVTGLLLLPVALVASRGGVTLPVGRLIERTGRAYAAARDRR